MILGVPQETYPGERRVALTPTSLAPLKKAGIEIVIQAGAGVAAGYEDAAYTKAGATLAGDRKLLFAAADVIVQVRALGANLDGWPEELALTRPGQTVIAIMDPLSVPEATAAAARKEITTFALELVPRIARAQAMDVLSSQSNLAGYKAVILAADSLSKIFPMLTTAAGTIVPSRVFVLGAGVAGLQAIATARRLGGVVSAYDVRPAVKEQVESLGARFVELPLEADLQDAGGYAKEAGAEFYAKQAKLMEQTLAEMDAVITTAVIPGKKAPTLITAAMVEKMQPGSVIVDIAAERGGNCELTIPGKTINHKGVTIIGPLNLPSTLAFHASQLYAKNAATFLLHLAKSGSIVIDLTDQITQETLLTQNGEVVNQRVRDLLGLTKPETVEQAPALAAAG